MGRIREWFFGTPESKSFPANLPTAPVTYMNPDLGPFVVTTSNGTELRIDLSWLHNASPVQMFRSQPYLRSVISFLGRNVAQLGVGTFLREGDDSRQRDENSVTAQLLRKPNPYMTRYELFDALVCDIALWDEGFWFVRKDSAQASGWRIDPLPSAWVTQAYDGNAAMPGYWQVTQPGKPTVQIPSSQIVHFHGWSPDSLVTGTSPIATLKAILEEQIAGVLYRKQRWERGARVGTVISRPADAPRWSEEAETRFRREFNEKYGGGTGSDSGGTPILQDGMTINRIGFSAVDDEYIEANKLALTTVAAVYHVNPTMVGLLDNANYSNVREFRRMLYGDTLGPWLAMIEGRVNGFLLPMIDAPEEQYIEFNINEKLQGSFEEQAAVASAAIGGPYMTRNEYRAKQNLPPIDGGDELIVPMNVTTGGQASPQDGLSQVVQSTFAPYADDTLRRSWGVTYDAGGWLSPPTGNRTAAASTGAPMAKMGATQRQVNGTAEVLRRFYKRQGAVVLTALGTKSDEDWWDEDRWDEELADDLYAVAYRVNKDLGGKQIDHLGLPDPFDPEANADYLRAVMATRAISINATTKAQIDDALSRAGEDDAPTPKDVFSSAQGERSTTGAQSLMTTVAGIAIEEAGKQAETQSGGEATKTWVVTSTNSRHPEMDGETVPMNENFSNGAAWPGDASLGPDETSGCTCELVINLN